MPAPSDLSDAPWELLARHLAGEVSAPERAALRSWVQADPQHLQLLTTVTRAWERAGEVAIDPPLFSPADVQAAWLRLQPLLGVPPTPPAPAPPVAAPWAAAGWWPVAAALAVVAGGGALWLARPAAGPAEVVVTYATAAQRQLLRLPDSSRVWLNAHSQLRYQGPATPAAAGPNRVQLTGEAYFTLPPTGGHPLTVYTAGGRVQPGPGPAAFHVRAYAAEDSVEVSVTRGRAWLLPPPPADSLLLPAGTRAALHAADAPGRVVVPARRTAVSGRNFRAWQTDTLRFEDAPVTQVARTLQVAYGTVVAWSSAGLGQCRFTGTFVRPQPAQVLAVVAAATASRLLPDGHGGYVLQGTGCAPPASATASAGAAPRP